MTAAHPTLLMTRPRPSSQRFLTSLAPAVFAAVRPVISPMIGIVPCDPPDLTGARGVIFTSRNGVEVASAQIQDRVMPVYCVGRATTRVARDLGWRAVEVGQDAGALITALPGLEPLTPLVHLHGMHTRGDVAAALTRAGLPTVGYVIYDQPERPLTPEARAALQQGPVIAPLFSPRSAALFAAQVVGAADLHIIALSEAVAAGCAGLSTASLSICAHPEAAEMRKLIAEVAGTCLRH